jgi:hypothetical protein
MMRSVPGLASEMAAAVRRIWPGEIWPFDQLARGWAPRAVLTAARSKPGAS